MSDTIKTSMFSNGTVLVYEGDGKVRKASKEENSAYLASLLPASYKGEQLQQVKFDPKDGCVYGKYATKQVKKTVFAQQSTNKTEPVDGTQKAKDTKVPRDKSKAAPETDAVSKDRPDVKTPKEVRTKEYQRGNGGEDLHTEVVPRSKGNSGLEGREKTTFEKEEADSATSGNPDSYVQDFTAAKSPEKAGSEMNHAAGTEIQFKSDQSIYQNLGLTTTAGEQPPWLKKDKKDDDGKEEDKDDEKDEKKEKKGNKPPWLDGKSGDAEEDDEEEKEEKKDKKAASKLKTVLAEKDKEITALKIKQARIKESISYGIALLKLNPSKYANAETFNELVENTAEKMSVEAIQTAIEELKTVQEAKEEMTRTIQASAANAKIDDGLVTGIVIQEEARFKKNASADDLKSILMSGTTLGQKMQDFEDYVPSEPK